MMVSGSARVRRRPVLCGRPPEDRRRMAVFPLAVPYLLNPAGIVVLVTASAEASTVAVLAVVVGCSS